MSLKLDIPLLRRRAHIEVEKLGGTADEVGRAIGRTADDASSRLSNVRLPQIDISGAVDSAKRTVDNALRAASESGDAIAHGAEKAAARASHLPDDVRATVDDLRSLRITRDRGRDPWPGVALIMGVAAGIVAMFLFDPRDGRRRRTVLRDKLGKWGRQAGREVRGRAVDVRNRSQGMVHEAKSALGVHDQGSAEMGSPEMGSPSSWPPADSTTSGQPDWTGTAGLEGRGEQGSSSGPVGVMGQPAVGAAVGAGAAEPGGAEYGDLTHEPAGQNGRDNIG